MKDIQPFIDLGFYTVPLNGTITRNEKEKKLVPAFPGPWKELYLEDGPYDPKLHNEKPPATGAFITGKRSMAISIDCDNQETYDIFKALDPGYGFAFESHGKTAGGASIIYRLNDSYADIPAFRIHEDEMQLDYQTDDLLQFLPSVGNESKVEWAADDLASMPELKEPPSTIINYLKSLHRLKLKSNASVTPDGQITNSAVNRHYKNLAPFIKAFLSNNKFDPALFRILTPNDEDFKQLPQYKAEKTLHPKNVPDGLGNKYLTSLMGVLVCDVSVSPKMFKQFMHAVNELWDPYSPAELNKMITYQMGRDRWVYDKDWHESVDVILTEYGTMVNVFYDPLTRIYYALDNTLGMSMFTYLDALPKHINSIIQGNRVYKTTDIYDYLENKRTIMSPLEPYGDLPPDGQINLQRFNLFDRSRAYEILLNPEAYADEYKGKTPTNTLAFFEHLIPDDTTRDYVLRFVLTKLLTLQFSEVVLYFLGKQGAGKNLFIDWLDAFTENVAGTNTHSADYKMVVEVDLENFLAKYNLWIVNALFANLDEYGEKTTSSSEDRRVLAQLKSYTGKAQIQLRTMSTDPIPATHRCTFILTANENRLSPDLEDRRLVLIDTPTQLQEADFVLDHGGKSEAIQALFDEQHLWAYYWATNYKQLTKDEYRTPPATQFKEDMILRHLPPSKRIVAAVYQQDVRLLIGLCEETDLMQELLDDAIWGAVSKTLLVSIFETMVEGTAARKSMLDKALRDLRINASKMRMGQRQVYGFPFSELKSWASKHQMADGILLSTTS